MENLQIVKKPSFAQKVNQGLLKAGVALTVTGLTVAANAAEGDLLDTTALTDGITQAGATNKIIFGVALTVLAAFVAWRYLKRGANAA